MAPFSSSLEVTVGDIERKVDMSLDDIIRNSKGMDKKQQFKDRIRKKHVSSVELPQVQHTQIHHKGHKPLRRDLQRREPQQSRVPIQQGRVLQQRREVEQGRVVQQRRDVLQRFVALRSSALRQEKLQEARARAGTSLSVPTKAPARQAGQVVAGDRVVPFSRLSRKVVPGTLRPVGVKMPMSNQLSMRGAGRSPVAQRMAPLSNEVGSRAQRLNWHSKKVMADGSISRKPPTLDACFASLREERQLQSQQVGPRGGWRG